MGKGAPGKEKLKKKKINKIMESITNRIEQVEGRKARIEDIVENIFRQ